MRNLITLLYSACCIASAAAQCSQIGLFDSDQFGGLSSGVAYNGKLYFAAFQPGTGRELWSTDGTEGGTQILADINLGSGNSVSVYFNTQSYILNDILYFLADNGVHGTELWRTDGTIDGTFMVRDCIPGATGSSFTGITHVGNVMYFQGGNGNALWRSDGTTDGTYAIRSFSIMRKVTAFNGNLFFSAANSNEGEELWRHHIGNNTTQQLVDLNGSNGASLPCNFHVTPNLMYFMANTNSGWELWKSGGTAATTSLVKDINPGNANGVLQSYGESTVVSSGNVIYFRATDGQTGFQLWKSDGTADGTQRVSALSDAVLPEIGYHIIDGSVLYTSHASTYFWRYDPATNQNTQSNYPSRYSMAWNGRHLFLGERLIYASKDSAYGCEIWLADGTAGGQRIVQETDLTDNWSPDFQQNFNTIIGALGSKVFFTNQRTHLNVSKPLFVFDLEDNNPCYAPSIIETVATSATSAQVIWNRPTEDANYEFRYRQVGSQNWITSSAEKSFKSLNNLAEMTFYEIQVRANCGSDWTDWSETISHNSAQTYTPSGIHFVAERAENPTIVRIYWLPAADIAGIQLRYRPYGTSSWQFANNANGYRRIQNLQPATLYEYQHRVDYVDYWGDWAFGFRYFVTPEDIAVATNSPLVNSDFLIYPNPTTGSVRVSLEAEQIESCAVIDELGRFHPCSMSSDGLLNLNDMPSGIYTVVVNANFQKVIKL